MATQSDLDTQPRSGLNHIDALLGKGPQWNFLTPYSNTLTYTFSTSAGMQTGASGDLGFTGAPQGFNATQQQGARTAMAYLSELTGIQFLETGDGNAANIHFANANLDSSNTTGLCVWNYQSFYNPATNQLTEFSPDAYVYLDNVEWAGQNSSATPGTWGYQTLLHELGHALGLKHPFEGAVQLPGSEDSTQYSLMSYDGFGGPYSTFQPYDIAALNFLYGGDGLLGAVGVGAASGAVYLTGTARADTLNGTAANDILQGGAGDDVLNGGAGTDTAVFSGASTSYSFATDANGRLMVSSALEGSDWLSSIEILRFSDRSMSPEQVPDTVPPSAPTLTVTKNGAGYVSGNTPLFAGFAEAGSTVKVYNGAALLGSAVASATGVWSLVAPALADGGYAVHATATDKAGNISAKSPDSAFQVDTHAPAAPTASVSGIGANGNQATFSGTGEAGSVIQLINTANGAATVLAEVQAGSSGAWSVSTSALVNGGYAVKAQSLDAAGNVSAGSSTLNFTVNSSLNTTGTAANNKLTANSAGNNAIDGGAGIDTFVAGGARANFMVTKNATGHTISSAATGTDALVNVERIEFADTWVALDINGNGGQAYRMFEAALNRQPLPKGVGFWINALDVGVTLDTIAYDFMNVPEFVNKYGAQGANLNNGEFVTLLFNNVLGRPPKEAGYNFWTGALDSGVSRAHVLAQISESPENQAQVIGTIQNGFEYTLWQG